MNKKLLRKKLALMLATLKKKRPYYCEVEYLQGTGTQYIDVPYTPKDTSGMRVVWSYTNNNDVVISGARKTTGGDNRWFIGHYSSGLYFGWNTLISTTTTSINTFYDCRLNFYNDRKAYINGEEKAAISTTLTTTDMAQMKLFWVVNAGNKAAGKLKLCQITEGNKLIYDFIPVLDWNMTPCMYDKVSGQLFYNQGTGTFHYGREIHYVDYLESTGEQYIDTGYIPSNTTGQYAKMQYNTVNNSVTFGCMVSGNGAVGPYYATSSSNVGWWTRWGTNEPRVIAPTPTTTDTYEMYLNFNNDRIARVDSTIIADNLGTISGNYPNLTLFKRNYTVGGNLTGKVFNYKITEGTNLVRDFIPAIDENGVGFMFDRVSHTIFDNAGTGAFKYPAREVEYLEGTGSQYIDTGITINTSTDEVVSDFQLISTTLYQWIMGEHDNGARFGIGVGDGTNKRNIAYGANTYKVQDAQVYNEKHNFKANSNGVFLDDVQIHEYENFASASTVYLFKLNLSSSNGAAGKIWYYKHKRNGTIVRDCIPVFYNGQAGMLDKQNNVFYSNAGSGNFATGKIIEKEYE